MNNKSVKDIVSTFLNQAWRFISGPILLLLIPLYLTEEQQGYWYLFGSIAALSTFADLGFSNIILQFSAHEYASLKIGKEGLLEGDAENIKKLGSFFRFVIGWLSTICAIVFPVIFIVGIFFLVRDNVFSIYFIPWLIYAVGSFINFFNNSVLSFIEGMDQISKVQKSRFIVSVINTIIAFVFLLLKTNIYALTFGVLISSCFMFVTIFKTFRSSLLQIWSESKNFKYPWKKEIVPLFKRNIFTCLSGYFLFQIYTPMMHYFHGPMYSGKVGLSMTLVNTMFAFSNIWIYTITPKINILIEKKNWDSLDKVFHKRLFLTAVTYIFITISFFIFMKLFCHNIFIEKILNRFFPTKGLIMLIICYFIQVIINSWAVYLRGHKIEPYWVTGILSAFWVFGTSIIAGKLFKPEYFFIGLLSSYVWVTPVSYLIYLKKKKILHKE